MSDRRERGIRRINAADEGVRRWRRHCPHRLDRAARMSRLTTIEPVPRTRLVLGTVVWAHVPFADGTGEKTRPAVVIARRGREVTVVPGTTTARRGWFPERYLELRDLVAAGLRQRTGMERRLVVLDCIDIVSVAGDLGDDDLRCLLSPELGEVAVAA